MRENRSFIPLQGEIGHFIVRPDKFLMDRIDKLFWYDESTERYCGSTFPFVARIDSIVRTVSSGRVRTTNLQDTMNPDLRRLISGKHYMDENAIVIHSSQDPIRENEPIIERIKQVALERNIPFELPCKVVGLDVCDASPNKMYNWTVVGRKDFSLIFHETLNFKRNRFWYKDTVNGFPIFEENGENGESVWHLRRYGATRLYLDGDHDVRAISGNLSGGDKYGAIFLTTDEPNSLDVMSSFREHLNKVFG